MYCFDDIVTIDPDMLANIKNAKAVVDAPFPVMIYGETGTGKELFAQAIHSGSVRSCKPFVAQNCAALPESVFESILWGVEKGAYTGAIEKPGLLEEADGGTLFLDEINSLPLHLQTKFLRVLENFKVLRVGASKTVQLDVRIITAMNDTPENVLANNVVRTDLFFRLSTGIISLSPLRKRQCDIRVYADYFIKEFNHKYSKNIMGISEEVEEIFNRYYWPGNVRELRHILESACYTSQETELCLKNIPNYFFGLLYGEGANHEKNNAKNKANQESDVGMYGGAGLEARVAVFEKQIIQRALDAENWNISQTAKNLQIPRQTLKYKIDRYGLLS